MIMYWDAIHTDLGSATQKVHQDQAVSGLVLILSSRAVSFFAVRRFFAGLCKWQST
jgi:ABC-type uncharacterized transport system permease subunit